MAQKHGQSNEWTTSTDIATQQTAATLVAAPGSGNALFITDIELYMGGTSRLVQLLSNTTVKWAAAPAISGQATAHFKVPIKLTANEALKITTAGASTGAFIVVNGFTARG